MSIKEQIVKLEKTAERRLTILWNEIEDWQQDNHYIHSGYRPASNSYKKSAHSLTYIHNETVNIYTHLLGAITGVFGSFLLYNVLHSRYETANRQDILVFSAFFLGLIGCLSCSAAFHLFSNHSARIQKFGNQLDYLGIVLLIWGSFVPSIYYGFTANPELVTLYWGMITSIGAATAAATMMPLFRTPTWRPVRAAMFVGMGLSAVVPVFHGLRMYGYAYMQEAIGVDWLVTQGALYILGAGIYAARVPEKWAPGRFDIVGSSHQIFHVLVLLAAAAHLKGLLVAFDACHGRLR
jgi:adiponectin receptor